MVQQLKERTESQLILENLPRMDPIKTPLLLMGQAFICPVWCVLYITYPCIIDSQIRQLPYIYILWIKEVYEKIRELHAMVRVYVLYWGH